MTELSTVERSTIEAIVDGIQHRSQSRRKASRQGWALLAVGGLSLPIIGSALDGTITLPTALIRIGIALVITTAIVSMVGSLYDSYVSQAAFKTVEEAVVTARQQAHEAARAVEPTESDTHSMATTARGNPDGDRDDN